MQAVEESTAATPQLPRRQRVRLRWVWSLGGLTPAALAKRVWNSIDRNDDFGRAAELAYYFILSLFPLLIFLSSVAGFLFASEQALYERLLIFLARVMPLSAFVLVRGAISDITSGASGGKLSIGLVITLWTASLAMDALITDWKRATISGYGCGPTTEPMI